MLLPKPQRSVGLVQWWVNGMIVKLVDTRLTLTMCGRRNQFEACKKPLFLGKEQDKGSVALLQIKQSQKQGETKQSLARKGKCLPCAMQREPR